MNTTFKYIFLIGLIILLISLFLSDLIVGTIDIPINKIFSILTGKNSEKEIWEIIIIQSRLPRALGAVVAGAALSVSGLLMQVLFRNPLAGPYILGISSGAGLGVALATISTASLGFQFIPNGFSLITSASVGALVIFFIIFFISLKVKDIMTLLIVGVLIGSIANSLVSILQANASAISVKTFVLWSFASLDQLTLNNISTLYIVCFSCIFLTFFLSKPLNALLMGEKYALSIGVNINKTRFAIIFLSGILAASVTAYCGPIGFIGIMTPHIVRIITKTTQHKLLILFSALMGSSILLISDLLSHIILTSGLLPLNSVTALIGIPVILWMMLGRSSISKSF